MKVSEHFDLQEFVDPVTFGKFGDKSLQFIDPKLFAIAEAFRGLVFGPATINTWHTGGQYKESGLRRFDTATGAKYSQHKFGRAIDIKIVGGNYDHLRSLIRYHWPELKEAGLTTIELDTPTWLHLDCRNTGLDSLYEIPFK